MAERQMNIATIEMGQKATNQGPMSPPTYDTAIAVTTDEVQQPGTGVPENITGTDTLRPPSYEAIFGKVKQAKAESSGNVDYGCKVFAILCGGTICGAIWVFLYLAIPLACIVIGAKNLNNCPIERYIPIYLIVAGTVGVFQAVVKGFCMVCCSDNSDDEDNHSSKNPVDSLLDCFMFAWFLAGSVWVYRAWELVNFHDPTLDEYCDKTTYLFTFSLITIAYSLMGLGLICCAAGLTAMICAGD